MLDAIDAAGVDRAAVDWLMVTHVHLDHAGAAGPLIRALPNAQLVVHPRGAPHMIDPTRLIAGAKAVYGEAMFERDHAGMLPVAEEYKKILLVEPAVADSITGDKWNKYIFRTGRNSSQDAIGNAVAADVAGLNIGVLAQDYAFGRDGVLKLIARADRAMYGAKTHHRRRTPRE